MSPLFENPANAIALWLNRNDIDYEDIVVKHNAGRNTKFRIEYGAEIPDGSLDATDNQLAFGDLLEETPGASGGLLGGKINDDSLREQLELPEPSGECRHKECDSPATTFTIAVEVPIIQQYCFHHSHRAAHHLFESDLEDYADEAENE